MPTLLVVYYSFIAIVGAIAEPFIVRVIASY